MAEPRPTGTAITMATAVTMRLPVSRVRMWYSPRRGNQPSEERTAAHSTSVTYVHVSRANENTISALIRIEVAAAARRTSWTACSVRVRRRSPARSSRVIAIGRLPSAWDRVLGPPLDQPLSREPVSLSAHAVRVASRSSSVRST